MNWYALFNGLMLGINIRLFLWLKEAHKRERFWITELAHTTVMALAAREALDKCDPNAEIMLPPDTVEWMKGNYLRNQWIRQTNGR